MTVPYPYGMQDMHETLDNLVGKRYYWSVDISSYYWQIELDSEAKELTAFVIPGGQKYQFTRVPFGLRSAGAKAFEPSSRWTGTSSSSNSISSDDV